MANFDPTTLFAGGEQGVIYDVQTLSSMFQDSAGTTPAVVDSPVGRINDLSGNGNHAVQTISGSRPTLRYAAGRGYYLAADGTDDYLFKAFTISQPITRISLVEQVAWSAPGKFFGGVGAPGINYGLAQHSSSPQINMHAGSNGADVARLPIGLPSLVTEIYNGASSQLGVNQDVRTVTNPGTSDPGGIALFAMYINSGAHFINARCWGVVMINRILTATEIENVQAWLTQRWTRVLVLDGDSNTVGNLAAATGTAFPSVVIPSLLPEAFVQNIAVSGTGLNTNATDMDTATRRASIDARIPVNKRGRQYILGICWSNNRGGDTAAEIATFLAARKTAGYDKVVLFTEVERADVGQDNTARRLAQNAELRAAGWTAANGVDALVDIGDIATTMGAVGVSVNTTYFESDKVHWKAAGHALISPILATAVNGIPFAAMPVFVNQYRQRRA